MAAATGHPAWQVAIFNKVMLGKPDKVCADLIQPLHLLKDLGIKVLIADPGIRWVTKIVGNAYP
jgi:hypothetical protein